MLVKLWIIYTGASMVLILAVCAITCRIRHKTENKRLVGVFASASWPVVFRGPWSLVIMLLAVLPSMIFLIAVLFGSILAAVEKWNVYIGIEYVLTNILGLQDPLTEVRPGSHIGKIIDVVMSIWSMLWTTTVTGVVAGMCLIQNVSDAVPNSVGGFFRYILLYIPLVLLLISLVTGGVMALIEDWSLRDGFLFMAGAIAGLANPIVNVRPATASGTFIESLCTSVELCLGGAVIGVVGGHPLVGKFISLFEGEATAVTLDFDDSANHADPVVEPIEPVNFKSVSLDEPSQLKPPANTDGMNSSFQDDVGKGAV